MASSHEGAVPAMEQLAGAIEQAGVQVRVTMPVAAASEARVMWSKLVRLCALACMTTAYDVLLGEIRSTPQLRAELVACIEEACAVAAVEGAPDVDPARAVGELDRAHETLGSSMQRDIAAGRTPELDAIPGSVLRAAARHDMSCPTIERLVARIAERAGIPRPLAG
jgi:ketopantoate reductase